MKKISCHRNWSTRLRAGMRNSDRRRMKCPLTRRENSRRAGCKYMPQEASCVDEEHRDCCSTSRLKAASSDATAKPVRAMTAAEQNEAVGDKCSIAYWNPETGEYAEEMDELTT